MNALKEDCLHLHDELVALRREFHRDPELGLHEYHTAARIERELDRCAIPHERIGETAVVARLRGTGAGTGVCVLRADIDALPIQETNDVPYRSETPGVMHACGHDAHTTCLIGAAKVLSAHRADFGGEVRFLFQPAEEIGEGASLFDVEGFGAAYAYTVDGEDVGEISYENFNAAAAVVTVHGFSVHPGSAKNSMINAQNVAMEFHAALPAFSRPEHTEGREGFFHLTEMSGSVTEATLRYIIRDHDRERFEEKKALFADCAARINEIYGDGTAEVTIRDSYYNMKEKILPHFHLIERAENAFRANGVTPQCVPIRGGTDGARLSWDGLPCPNLSTGGYNYHGVREWIPADSLEAMTNVLVTLTESFAE